MERIHALPYSDVAATYDLGNSETGLILRIHPAIYRQATDLLANPALGITVGTGLVHEAFMPPSDGKWGFKGSLCREKDDDRGWTQLSCPFPITVGESYDWERLYAVSCTLNALFCALNLASREGLDPNGGKELAQVFLGTESRLSGFFVSAVLSPAFMEWLRNAREEDLADAARVMFSMGTSLFGKAYGAEEHEFDVRLRDRWRLILTVPGNACDIGVDGSETYEKGCGTTLEPHNIDNPMAQLTLLCGVSALCERARLSGA